MVDVADRKLLEETFSRALWTSATEALLDALGLSVTVFDADASVTVAYGPASRLCEAALGSPGIPSASCLSELDRKALRQGLSVETECAAGLACRVAPVVVAEKTVGHIMVSGYVGSKRAKGPLRDALTERGMSSGEARALVDPLTILNKRRVRRVVAMLVELGSSLVAAAERERLEAVQAKRSEAGATIEQEFAEAMDDVDKLRDSIARLALKMVAGDAAALVVRSDNGEPVLAATSGETAALMEALPMGTLRKEADEVFVSGRSVLATGLRATKRAKRPPRTVLKVPLPGRDSVLGVLLVGDFGYSEHRLDWNDLRSMDVYGSRAGAALQGVEDSRLRSQRAGELEALVGMGKVLARENDPLSVVRTAAALLDKWMDFEVGGVMLDSGPEPHARVVLHGDVARADLDEVCAEVLGRHPNDGGHDADVVTVGGTVSDREPREDWTVLSVPLLGTTMAIGALFAASPRRAAFTEADERSLRELADVVASALETALRYSALTSQQERTMQTLVVVADAAESYASPHTGKVMDYAMAIGDEMGLGFRDIEALRFAGLLHDVGMVGVSRDILLKPSRLTEAEMAQVRPHAELGASIVEQMDFLDAVTPIVLHHHERWDGGGYPKGIAGEQIPFLARILAVADAFAAMTSGRAFRPAMSPLDAIDEIRAVAGQQFDPNVVEALVTLLERRASAAATGLLADHLRAPGRHMPT